MLGGSDCQQGGGNGERQEGAEHRHPGEAGTVTQAGGRVCQERVQVRNGVVFVQLFCWSFVLRNPMKFKDVECNLYMIEDDEGEDEETVRGDEGMEEDGALEGSVFST